MIVIKADKKYWYESAKMVKLCEPYITVKELMKWLSFIDDEEVLCLQIGDGRYTNFEIEEVGE